MTYQKGFQSGFSLVELMITISIIAVIVTASLFSYQGIQKKSRDATRQGDLKVIQSALEQYKADQGFYPTALAYGSPFLSTTGNPNALPSGATARTYLNTTPQDKGTTAYSYVR